MSVIRLNKALTVMLPFRRHSLQLRHRLLESLGQVSRFMLETLHDKLPCEALPVITGLSVATVNQQLRFLTQHGFLDGMEEAASGMPPSVQLSDRGVRTVLVDRMLRNQDLSLWLDAFTLNRSTLHVLAGSGEEQLLPNLAAADIHSGAVAVMPMRQRQYHVFDEIGRLHKLLGSDTLAELLTLFWPAQEALIQAELDHWEITLERPASTEPSFLPVTLGEDEVVFHMREASLRSPLPEAWLPALVLNTRYSSAEGLPWPVSLPAPSEHAFEMVSLSTLPPALALQAVDGPRPKGAMELPIDHHGCPAAGPAVPLPLGVKAEVTVRSNWLRAQLLPESLLPPLQRCSGPSLFSTDIRPATKPAEATA